MIFTKYKVEVRVFIINVLLLSIATTQSQGMLVGDRISDFELKQMLNYTPGKARLTDFANNKALLVDFWFTACASCIESFPKLDSIQKEFKDDLNILLVTFESKEKVLKTFSTLKRISHVKLPSVVADTLMHLIFPHTTAPHEIWIGKDRKIKAITDHTSINRDNIKLLIDGKDLKLPIKKDNMEYSLFDPLVKNMELDRMFKYNIISSNQPGLPASDGMYIHPDNGFLRAQATNVDFQSLYVMAYNQWSKGFNYGRLIIDSSVMQRLQEAENGRNTFCYDSWWKDTSRINACTEMQNELDHFFNLKSYLEIRKIPCIVLRQKGTKKRFISTATEGREEAYYKKDTLCLDNVYLKYPVETILNYGRHAWSPFQFLDETGYDEKVTIRLPGKFEDLKHVNYFLKDFDLEIAFEERWFEVVVIKDNDKL
ncbi:MAG: redoxin domain-containing protein [Chitinophagaceae bacterium]|nr:redoxin domain-containing protein [Chitinophagaceae bacterium]